MCGGNLLRWCLASGFRRPGLLNPIPPRCELNRRLCNPRCPDHSLRVGSWCRSPDNRRIEKEFVVCCTATGGDFGTGPINDDARRRYSHPIDRARCADSHWDHLSLSVSRCCRCDQSHNYWFVDLEPGRSPTLHPHRARWR